MTDDQSGASAQGYLPLTPTQKAAAKERRRIDDLNARLHSNEPGHAHPSGSGRSTASSRGETGSGANG